MKDCTVDKDNYTASFLGLGWTKWSRPEASIDNIQASLWRNEWIGSA